MSIYLFLRRIVEDRLDRKPLEWFRSAAKEVWDGVSDVRYGQVISLASRHVGRVPLVPKESESAGVAKLVEGLCIDRWSLLETVRITLILSRGDLAEESGACAVGEAFRFADEGELCALYRSLAMLPEPERFVWRAAEGCRTNMRSVFEAAALDTPFPFRWFDDVAWRQAVVKCVFIGAPLWRMVGLDERLSPELARMALDLADERRSAGRTVPPDLWMCLGEHGGKRGSDSLEQELDEENPNRAGRMAAAFGLARAGKERQLRALLDREKDAQVAEALRTALAVEPRQAVFQRFALSTT